jgi:hypothetical protein
VGETGLEVLQGVLVHGVVARGRELLVDVYGSTSNLCGSVRFVCSDRREQRRNARVLRRWAAEGLPLTLIRSARGIALQNDVAALPRGLAAR